MLRHNKDYKRSKCKSRWRRVRRNRNHNNSYKGYTLWRRRDYIGFTAGIKGYKAMGENVRRKNKNANGPIRSVS